MFPLHQFPTLQILVEPLGLEEYVGNVFVLVFDFIVYSFRFIATVISLLISYFDRFYYEYIMSS